VRADQPGSKSRVLLVLLGQVVTIHKAMLQQVGRRASQQAGGTGQPLASSVGACALFSDFVFWQGNRGNRGNLQ